MYFVSAARLIASRFQRRGGGRFRRATAIVLPNVWPGQ